MSRLLHALVLVSAAVAGCGGDDDAVEVVDGALAPDAGGDTLPADCTGESDDPGNGDIAEPTGLTFAGRRVALCGTLDPAQANGDVADRDLFQITVAPTASVVVRLSAPLAGAYERVDLVVRGTDGPRAVARVRAGNAVTSLALLQGAYTIGVEARAGGSTVLVPYRLEVYADDPQLRCPPATGGPYHPEADETTAAHRANDVVEAQGAPPLLTTRATLLPTDAADATNKAVSAGDRFTINGTSASVPPAGDAYHDRDTFSFYTGATTNQLDVRVSWTGNIADLDVQLFEADDPTDPMGTPTAAFGSDEIVITSVEPSTLYWLWVGGSTRSVALPVSYAVHVCGREIAAAPMPE